ncbi:MlaD family protein [Chlamydiota bacterium]
MEGKNMEFKVGLFIFIALLCVAVMIVSFGIEGVQFIKKTYEITAIFKFTNGVIIGAPVRSAGVEVGKVVDITFSPKKDNNVRVTMKIQNDIVLRNDTRITINSLGIIGEKYIEFVPQSTDAPKLKNGDILRGEDPVSLNDVMKSGEEMLFDIRTAITALLDEENVQNVKEIIENVKTFSESDIKEIKDEVTNSLTQFRLSMDKLHETISHIDEIISENKNKIEKGIGNAHDAFFEIKESSIAVREAIVVFKQFLEKITRLVSDIKGGEGTIGQFISKKEFYDESMEVMTKLNSFMDNITKYGLLYKPKKERKKRR